MNSSGHVAQTNSQKVSPMSRILVAEDSRISRRVVVQALQEAGHEVIEAVNGSDALEQFTASRPDCIVSDLLMPVMEGQELLRRIREIDTEIPVIIASADVQRTSRETCEALGISGFIHKPVDRQILIETVDAALRQHVGTGNHGH